MSKNKGKNFEWVIREAFEKVPNTSVYRLQDSMSKFRGACNIADFVIYHYPYQYFIECKTVAKENTLSIYGAEEKHQYGNIRNGQWEGLLKMSKIQGVFAGVLCWWQDKDVTRYMPIQFLDWYRNIQGKKSIRYDYQPPDNFNVIDLEGTKKRTYYNYDMEQFFRKFEVK